MIDAGSKAISAADVIDQLRIICDRRADRDDSRAVHSHGTEIDKRVRVSRDRERADRRIVNAKIGAS